jgi:hypothetical protein
MTPAERAAVLSRILAIAIPVLANPASPPGEITRAREALRKVTTLIDSLHAPGPAHAERSPEPGEPHVARARARRPPADDAAEAERARRNADRAEDGLHGIRKGRLPCEATCRDGTPCKAPAIAGGSVCRRHGGAAPQVAIAARHMELLLAHAEALEAHAAARGTPAGFGALCRWSAARNALDEYEAKLTRLRQLRADLRRRKEATSTSTPCTAPRALDP